MSKPRPHQPLRLELTSNVVPHRNKLDLVSLSTHRRADQEVEDVPIRPIKPFYFSKVAAYARDW